MKTVFSCGCLCLIYPYFLQASDYNLAIYNSKSVLSTELKYVIFFFFTAKPSANQIMNADSLQDDNMGNLYLHLFGHSGIYNCNLMCSDVP